MNKVINLKRKLYVKYNIKKINIYIYIFDCIAIYASVFCIYMPNVRKHYNYIALVVESYAIGLQSLTKIFFWALK